MFFCPVLHRPNSEPVESLAGVVPLGGSVGGGGLVVHGRPHGHGGVSHRHHHGVHGGHGGHRHEREIEFKCCACVNKGER